MQIRPAILPRLQKPSPNNSTSSGPRPMLVKIRVRRIELQREGEGGVSPVCRQQFDHVIREPQERLFRPYVHLGAVLGAFEAFCGARITS